MKLKKLLSIIITMTLTLLIISSCATKQPSATNATKLVKYSSYAALERAIDKRIKDANKSGHYFGSLNKNALEEAATDALGGTGDRNSLQDYSKTNLQVEGVDEADIVKTDGKFLYIIANGRFIIVDANDPANMKIVSQIQYLYVDEPARNTVTPVEMLLDEANNRITLISYSYDDRMTKAILTQTANDSSGSKAALMPEYNYGFQNVLAQVIDLKDITKPAIVREFLQEGSYISSRRIDEYVYLVTNKYVYTYAEITDKSYYIPATKDSQAGNEWALLPVDSISIVPNQYDNSFLVLSSVNTLDVNSATQTKAILGAGQNIYASPTGIYIASTRYTYESVSGVASVKTDDTVTGGSVTNDGTATASVAGTETSKSGETAVDSVTGTAPDAVTGSATDPVKGSESGATETGTTGTTGTGSVTATDLPATISTSTTADTKVEPVTGDAFKIYEAPVYKMFTDIYRFEINKGAITEKGTGVVPGYILNQFSMDENNGYFRIATTSGDSWRSDEYTSMNNIYVLDNNLKITGKIEGLASRETIKSVRFLGNKAYLVTFRTVDPLFVIDLTDPAKPAVKGELKIPGYSEYLHPVSDTIVLGFGKDAFEENDMAYYLGFKVSVFDVSDVANPKEISTMIIGDRGTYSELSTNHKALLYSKEKNVIGFPITIYTVPASMKSDKHSYGYPTFTGFIVLGLTADNKLFEKGRIAHYDLQIPAGYPTDYTQKTEDWSEFESLYQNEYLYRVNRGMFIGDTIFTVSNAFVKSNSLIDFKSTGSLDVPGFIEYNQYSGGIKGEPAVR
ncbi:MAG: beta-propeller domain-containing protein [Saccharofermentanales bacterium]